MTDQTIPQMLQAEVWSGSALFAQNCLSQYLEIFIVDPDQATPLF